MKLHPAQRFVAPSAIERGKPLKELLDHKLVALIGESLDAVVPEFDLRRFQQQGSAGLEGLELKERALHIARAMASQLPEDFDAAAPLLIDALGPPLESTEGNGLAVFFYMPHASYLAEHGASIFESGMKANFELTKRFTAEFSIRPLLVQHRAKSLRLLAKWASDPNPHVRRLVSEGTRPRLPWAMRLPEFQADPNLALPLLEKLKDDGQRYVCRSVANHLGDIAKDHAEAAFDVCERWLAELKDVEREVADNRRWLIRHALRHPDKKGIKRAKQLRALAKHRRR
ncbi:MAG: hypothetical protein KDB14_24455 [Planctomycetales bacterium]|nr:hypothetical protein [Planctomycetales bacterium]